ncbi:uncharacterized protein LOC112589032 [Harpegnathos saltator]|uniref:uncharacterized protein LOC112589032 n=1 Tax=Harpegnathos saltator TaxID=610380 RepID=UPI000DBEE00E|nr:uncharacterized protein LOC112589032 [Harpegnathos saltator]
MVVKLCPWAPPLTPDRQALKGLLDTLFPRVHQGGGIPPRVEEGKAPGSASAYRPICLLDEAGKMLERIIADRLVRHLSTEEPDLDDRQYGFRPRRLTLDAIQCVQDLARTIVEEEGGVLLAGSVLGPLLWNIAFDRLLCTPLALGCHVVCYVDDTLVLAWEEARFWVEAALVSVVDTIKDLGLKVAPQKTEAVFFHNGSCGAPSRTRVLVDGVRIHVGPTMKYLPLTLSSRWDFGAHFKQLAPRMRKAGLKLAPQLMATGRSKRLMSQAMRPVVVRAIRGYRTVSYIAATTLAGSLPVEFLAEERCILYWRVRELRE